MTTKVSVITTVYNGESYFDRAIPSILNQTYKDFEFIIVDDGSTDNTSERLHEIAKTDSRIRILNPGRLGFTKALNFAISQASGEYIFRQDFDDLSYPERFREQVNYLDSNHDVGVVGGYYVIVDEKRSEKYVRITPTDHNNIVRSFARYIPFAHTIVAFRKKAWEEAGGYPEVKDLEDIRLWIKFVKLKWKCANINVILGEHYVHEASFWHTNFRYVDRQRNLAKIQAMAIKELRLPIWNYIFPFGRYFYAYFPKTLKKVIRRTLGNSIEKDLR